MNTERRTLMGLAYEERSDLARHLCTLTPQQW